VKKKIGFCTHKNRKRVESIIEDMGGEREKENHGAEHTNTKNSQELLDFEISSYRDQYPQEYFVPSVSIEEAMQKIETIQQIVTKYIPAWLEHHHNTGKRTGQ